MLEIQEIWSESVYSQNTEQAKQQRKLHFVQKWITVIYLNNTEIPEFIQDRDIWNWKGFRISLYDDLLKFLLYCIAYTIHRETETKK